MYNIWWLFWITLNKLNLYDFYKTNNSTIELILLGIVFFNLGSLVFIKKLKIISFKPLKITHFKKLDKVESLLLLYLFVKAIQMFFLMRGHQYSEIREVYFGINTGKPLFYKYEFYISELILYYNYFIFLVGLTNNKYKKLYYKGLLYIMINAIISGGRLQFTFIIINLFYSFILKKYYKKILLLIIPSSIIILISNLRASHIGIFKFITWYYGGSITSFDIWLKREFSSNKFYGTAVFQPLDIILTVIKKVLFIEGNLAETIIRGKLGEYWPISEDIYTNAFTTTFHWFYLDAGIIGIIFYSFVIGFLHNIFFYTNRNNKNAIGTKCYLIYLLLNGILTFQYTVVLLFPIFLFLYFQNYNSKNMEFD
ncbi:O-antigen polymerase [Cetobacterium sp.]|uniref:O-antigen polymerase n=1 Tax=Cetobacterium sp. TaxID=2071632 RepID=UPI003F3D25D0